MQRGDVNFLKGQVFAFDFDRTLTIKHTFHQTSLALNDGSPRVVTVPIRRSESSFGGIFSPAVEYVQELPDFSYSITDQQVKSNLRNPEKTKQLIKYIIDNGGKVCIISLHNNIAWIKRNLNALLEDNSMLNQINIYALQSPEHAKFFKNKLYTITTLIEEDPLIDTVTLIDDDVNEIADIRGYKDRFKVTDRCRVDCIHADVTSDDYLTVLAGRVHYTFEAAATAAQYVQSPSPSYR